MAAKIENGQHWLDRNRPPRVQITYDVEIGNAIEKRELPFIVGIMADLSGKRDKELPKIKDRKFVELDLTDPPLRFDLLANAMGVPSRRVERPEDLAAALKEGIAHNGPYLIDVAMEGPVPLPA